MDKMNNSKIVNPLTGRLITLYGALHRRLIREAILDPAGRSLISAAPQAPKTPKSQPKKVKAQKKEEPEEEGLGDLSELDKLLGAYIDRETGEIDHAGYNAQFEIYDERINPEESDRRARERNGDYDPRDGNPDWDGQPDDESDDELTI